MMQARSVRKGLATLVAPLASLPSLALAQSADPHRWQLNMGQGVTHTSRIAYESHMIALLICVAIGVIVFGAMAWSMFKFRKSKGAVAAQFSHNTTAEIIWTVVPVLILVGLAWPATANLINMYDTRDAGMTVKVTGYQWMWRYEYLGEGVEFTSRLDRKSDTLRQSGKAVTAAEHPHYLLDVDNALVLPVDTKVRFVVTADDVIHAWWVPALGWKQDAIPGIVNEAWAKIDKPGLYRGQCAELCGKDHGFMPIVVRALPKAEYAQWLAAEKAKNAPGQVDVPATAPGQAVPTAGATQSPATQAVAQPAPPAASTEQAVPTAGATQSPATGAVAQPASAAAAPAQANAMQSSPAAPAVAQPASTSAATAG